MREAEIGRIELSGQIRQESFQDSISMEKKLGVVVLVIPVMGEA
jgi:hypothetical protein